MARPYRGRDPGLTTACSAVLSRSKADKGVTGGREDTVSERTFLGAFPPVVFLAVCLCPLLRIRAIADGSWKE